jgi:hypothetical protein
VGAYSPPREGNNILNASSISAQPSPIADLEHPFASAL